MARHSLSGRISDPAALDQGLGVQHTVCKVFWGDTGMVGAIIRDGVCRPDIREENLIATVVNDRNPAVWAV